MTKKTIFSALAFFFVSTLAWAGNPSVIALQFHADFCPACKVLDPNLTEAKGTLAEESVLFVKLDHTSKASRHQAKLLAESLELDKIYAKEAKKSGFVLLVDTETGNVIERITRNHSAQDIERAITKAINT